MSRRQMELSDEQWKRIEPLLPEYPMTRVGGRRRVDNRRVLEGILWVLRTGARWKDLPEDLPSPSTCWRRLREWDEDGIWDDIWRSFLAELAAHPVWAGLKCSPTRPLSRQKKEAHTSTPPDLRSRWSGQLAADGNRLRRRHSRHAGPATHRPQPGHEVRRKTVLRAMRNLQMRELVRCADWPNVRERTFYVYSTG